MPSVRYDNLPQRWIEGLPLGNGEIGVMCWSDGRQLEFTLDSASAWDLRRNPPEAHHDKWPYSKLRERVANGDFETIREARVQDLRNNRLGPRKVYLGRLELGVDLAPDCDLRLSLEGGMVGGTVSSGETDHRLTAFVCRKRDLFCFRFDPWPAGVDLAFLPFYETSPGLAELGHPEVQTFTIRIFPAAPPRWQDALFVDLLTEGAFKVSALKVEGQVRWVRIRSGVERLCRLRNPFGARPYETEGCNPRQEGDLLVWPTSEGQTATLFAAGYGSPDLKKELDRIRKLKAKTLNIE